MKTIQLSDLDRRIWEEELSEFVPKRVFDAHSHIYSWAFNTDPEKDRTGIFGRKRANRHRVKTTARYGP